MFAVTSFVSRRISEGWRVSVQSVPNILDRITPLRCYCNFYVGHDFRPTVSHVVAYNNRLYFAAGIHSLSSGANFVAPRPTMMIYRAHLELGQHLGWDRCERIFPTNDVDQYVNIFVPIVRGYLLAIFEIITNYCNYNICFCNIL